MFKKLIPFITLLLIVIEVVLSQGAQPVQGAPVVQGGTIQGTPQTQQQTQPQTTPGQPQGQPQSQDQSSPVQGPLTGPKHPKDLSLFLMEKSGKHPKDVNFKLETTDVPNIIVEVTELKDHDHNQDIITNKSKLRITWDVISNNTGNNNGFVDTLKPKTFTLKLLSNVTQDSVTSLFYPYNEQQIDTNVQKFEYEYNVPKLDEKYVYNVAVIADPIGVTNSKNVGVSRSLIYQLYEHSGNTDNNDTKDESKGLSPMVFVGIGVAALALIALALLISKKLGKNDVNDDEDDFNLPVQSPTSPNGNFNYKNDLDRVSVVTDDTGEVSWSNLEIANDSEQTKNENNNQFFRTLDKTYKRDFKKKTENYDVGSRFDNPEEVQIYKVVRMFVPTEEDEIALNIGDDVQITTIFEDGWCEGINKSTNEDGIFPRTCVVESEQYSTMIERSKSSALPNRRRSKRSLSYRSPTYKSEHVSIPE